MPGLGLTVPAEQFGQALGVMVSLALHPRADLFQPGRGEIVAPALARAPNGRSGHLDTEDDGGRLIVGAAEIYRPADNYAALLTSAIRHSACEEVLPPVGFGRGSGR